MAVPILLFVAEAAAFTIGCAVIHASRNSTDRMTDVLVAVAFGLFLALLVAIIPANFAEQEQSPDAGASLPNTLE